jgi:hypothetical protein
MIAFAFWEWDSEPEQIPMSFLPPIIYSLVPYDFTRVLIDAASGLSSDIGPPPRREAHFAGHIFDDTHEVLGGIYVPDRSNLLCDATVSTRILTVPRLLPEMLRWNAIDACAKLRRRLLAKAGSAS